MFDSTHVPATPPATPPSDQEKTTSTLSPAGSVTSPEVRGQRSVSSLEVRGQRSISDPEVRGQRSISSPEVDQTGQTGDQHRYHINQQAAAVHAMAYAQACHAMQSFMSRSIPLGLPQHNFQVIFLIFTHWFNKYIDCNIISKI